MGESLVALFGEDEASVAEEIVAEKRVDVMARVKKLIDARRTVFHDKSSAEQATAALVAKEHGAKLAAEGHHCVACPACACVATLQGKTFGKEHVEHDDDEIVVRQSVALTSFFCEVCGLKLTGHAELEAAELGGQYTRRTTYTPEEYYGLVNPDDLDDDGDEDCDGFEYDNE